MSAKKTGAGDLVVKSKLSPDSMALRQLKPIHKNWFIKLGKTKGKRFFQKFVKIGSGLLQIIAYKTIELLLFNSLRAIVL